MIERERRAQKPRSTSTSLARRRPTRWPKSDRSAGWSVSAAAIEASGTRTPPTPIERMNGTGMKRSTASPIATASPEKTTARPAVSIVRTTASSVESPRSSSSRKR